jgi:hypothetical protein
MVLLSAAAILLLGAGPASAARTLEHEITESSGPNGTTLVHPEGVAIDATDHLWVTENFIEHANVEKYGLTGSWEANVGTVPWPANPSLESIAFDKAAGALFVSESGSDEVFGLNPTNAQYDGTHLLPLGAPRANGSNCCDLRLVADNSGDAYDGDLYVFAGNGGGNAHVIRIDASGAPVDYTEGSSAGTDELTGADTPSHSFAGPGGFSGGGIAVDAVGHLWVADGANDALDEFAPSGRYLRSITQIAPGEPLGQLLAVAIDPTTGNVLVNNVEINGVDEFTPSGTFVAATRPGLGGQALGIAVDSTGKLYIANSSGPSSAVEVFSHAGAPAARLPLTVTVTGEGEVSGPGGIACTSAGNGTSACESELVEGSEVELEAAPAEGYTFAGWLGCKRLAAGRCEVALSAAQEVTAVFLKEAEAPVITPFAGNEHGCAGGGVAVTVGASTTYVCNGSSGANGANGTNGTTGKEGPKGSEGPQGIEGIQGVEGPRGKEGTQGKEGAQGKVGPQGPQGPVAKVTCKVKQQGTKKVKVICTVAQSASSASVDLRWHLVHDGRSVNQGISRGALRLNLHRLHPGRYLLYVQGQRHATAIVLG